MFEQIVSIVQVFEDGLWGYLGVPALMSLALYLSFQSNFFQLRKLPYAAIRFFKLLRVREHGERGVHPLKAFFACIGGCVGIGNIAGICTAVQIGGPGALFWIWMTAIAGMIVKYAEVYLGVAYRVPNEQGGYNGGPMYFLQRVFKGPFVPSLVCVLLCIYGVEVYQFSVITDSIVTNLNVNSYVVIAALLALVIFAGSGGVRRVGAISSAIIPLFVALYVGMGFWVLVNNFGEIPGALGQVFSSAFSGSAALGGFAGSTFMITLSQGVRRGCYVGDLGVGYASIIHSETNAKVPQDQASLVLFEIFFDTFIICTTSVMLILVTHAWHLPLSSSMMVQNVLSQYFPYMQFFMPLFFFLLGYSTLTAYFCVGIKCAEFLSPKRGKKVFYAYAIVSLIIFSFMGNEQAQSAMSIGNALLLLVNTYGIFRLRNEISYTLSDEKAARPEPVLVEAEV